tara:strand:- start:50 stop:337 length:288 start_codon:yes stop_codon:yes gene_type:complete
VTAVTFQNKENSLTKICSPLIVSALGSLVILNPQITDGFGEKMVSEGGRFKLYSEVIFFSWETKAGERNENVFSGVESYFLQSTVESLESLQTGA